MQHLAKPLLSLLGCIGGSGILLSTYALKTQFAPPHNKTNKMACAPSEDSDQPRHPPSLIRVFVVRMKKALVLSYPLSASEDFDQTWRKPRLIGVFTGHTCHFVGFVIKWLNFAVVRLSCTCMIISNSPHMIE